MLTPLQTGKWQIDHEPLTATAVITDQFDLSGHVHVAVKSESMNRFGVSDGCCHRHWLIQLSGYVSPGTLFRAPLILRGLNSETSDVPGDVKLVVQQAAGASWQRSTSKCNTKDNARLQDTPVRSQQEFQLCSGLHTMTILMECIWLQTGKKNFYDKCWPQGSGDRHFFFVR